MDSNMLIDIAGIVGSTIFVVLCSFIHINQNFYGLHIFRVNTCNPLCLNHIENNEQRKSFNSTIHRDLIFLLLFIFGTSMISRDTPNKNDLSRKSPF